MLSTTQAKIESILNEIKELQEPAHTKYWYVATITFDTEAFYKRVYSVSDFYKLLSNSKSALIGNPSNREWWKRLSPSGFYDFNPSKDITVLSFVLETKNKLNHIELKARIKKIVPYIEINIENQTQKEYESQVEFVNAFFQKYEDKTEMFGNIKRNLINKKLPF